MVVDVPTLRNICASVDVIALPTFVLSCDDDGEIRFQHLNPAHIAAIGVEVEAVKGKTPAECLPARIAETVLDNYLVCRQTARLYEYEELLRLGDAERWWRTSLSPILAEDGSVSIIIGIASDITDQKERDFRRTKSESALRKLNDEMALFTSMTAHDVRGPLNKIASLSEITLDGFNDCSGNQRDTILTIQKIAGGTLRHIDSILGYAAALRLGDRDLSTINLGHMCRDIAAVVDPEAKMSIVSPDVFIEGESTALQIILRNLSENAIRHTNSHLEIAVMEAKPGMVRFSVADNGPGFAGGAKAFDETMRLRDIRQGNRGFGLAAVAHLVESRGGRIWLDKPVFRQGATICFDLPGRIVWQEETMIPYGPRRASG